jgi:hypothetical protein
MDFSEIKYRSTGRLPLKILAKLKATPVPSIDLVYYYILWQYGLWSFQTGGTKLEIFLPKNKHT